MTRIAKFLLLLDEPARVVLLDECQQHLGDVIEDDDFIVDSLMRGAQPCPVPGEAALQALTPAPSPQRPMRCFELH